MKNFIYVFVISLFISGCTQMKLSVDQSGREPITNIQNSKTVNMPKKEVWKHLIQGIGETFYVINNLDVESGLINVSYSGDPEKYTSGDMIVYNDTKFPATKKQFLDRPSAGEYFIREVNLDGRINITVMELDSASTKITVRTRYILNLKAEVSLYNFMASQYNRDSKESTVAFNTNEIGQGGQIRYWATGELEYSILDIIK